MAALAHSRGLGICGFAGDDHGAAIYFALPREALQLWISGVPESRRSSRDVGIIEAGRDRRATYGGLHDGSRGECERAGVSSPGLHVLQRPRRTGRIDGQSPLTGTSSVTRSYQPVFRYVACSLPVTRLRMRVNLP